MTKIAIEAVAAAIAFVLANGGVAEAQGLGGAPSNWNGFYIGAHLGNTWSDTTSNVTNIVTGAAAGSGTSSVSNPNGGIQGGYDYALSSQIVLGALASVSLVNSSDITTTSSLGGANVHTTKADTDWSGNIRARLGYSFGNALLFGSAGWAWSTGSATRTQLVGTTGLATPGTVETVGISHSGWTLGGGLEFALAPQWTLFGEYRHSEFDTENITFPIAQRLTNSSTTSDALTFGMNYKF